MARGLDESGFSYRRFTRDAFDAFVTEAALSDPELQSWFYGQRPELDTSHSSEELRAGLARGFWLRTPGCLGAELDPPPSSLAKRQEMLEKSAAAMRAPAAPPGTLCLFSQMRPSKNVAVVALARRLNVTHLVESGRKGGMSAYVYSVLGLEVTSVELFPIPYVAHALTQLAPGMELVDGDGTELVPRAVRKIRRETQGARVAVVLDGPKYEGAYRLFQEIRDEVVFAVFDDVYPGSTFRQDLDRRELLVWYSDGPAWLKAGLPGRDMAKASEGWVQDEREPATQYVEDWQTMAILAGGLWHQWF